MVFILLIVNTSQANYVLVRLSVFSVFPFMSKSHKVLARRKVLLTAV